MTSRAKSAILHPPRSGGKAPGPIDTLRREWSIERSRPYGARERALRRPHLAAERGHPAHQPEPGLGHRAGGGRRECPRAHRRPLGRDHDDRRAGRGPGLRHIRPFSRRVPEDGGVVRRAATLRTPSRPGEAAPGGGSAQLPRLARPLADALDVEVAAWDPDAPPGRASRQLLSQRQGGRRGVHGRGRGDPGAFRLAGGDGDRERAHVLE